MDSEFSNVQLDIKGIKLDGDGGVKAVNSLHQLKSADYLVNQNGECIFIEFSDLELQLKKLKGVERSTIKKLLLELLPLAEQNIHFPNAKEMDKICFRIIIKEVLAKMKDSILLINLLKYPLCNNYSFWIVVKNDDEVFMLDTLLNDIKSGIPNILFKQIRLCSLKQLQEELR